ncbi:MAG: class I SAM-dependent methyltransferase, partial [Thaumarchaeota archaeon]|nr:class I SAM-dependent methyltransferase [Nitrososphaerota archaeon]
MKVSAARGGSSEPYTKMARYYDIIYSKRINYESQADYLEQIFAKRMKKVESILDVASGTGNYTLIFAKRGYAATGIDMSDEMVRLARKKAGAAKNPRFFKMDMRHLEHLERFDAITVLFGGFGYLHDRGDVESFLQGSRKHLNRGGLLVFEFWQNSAMNPAAIRPSGHDSWDRVQYGNKLIIRLHLSKYDAQTNIQSVRFDHYVLDIRNRKLLDTFSETHLVKTYSISHIQELLERNGFESVGFYDGDIGNTKNPLTTASFSTFRVLAV